MIITHTPSAQDDIVINIASHLIPAGWHDQVRSLLDSIICYTLLFDSCRGLTFTVPPDNTTGQGVNITFQWNATFSEFNTTNPTVSFAALLIFPPGDNYHCPQTNIITQLGANVDRVIEDMIIVTSPSKQNNSVSGSVLLRPVHSQTHFVCAYGNFTQPLADSRDVLDLKDLESLSLINESPAFLVKQKAVSTTNTSTSSSSIRTASDNSPPTPKLEGNPQSTTDRSNLALIVGLSTGLASLISIIATSAIFVWRRRKQSQRQIRTIFTIEEASTRPASLTPYPPPGEISVLEQRPRQKEVERRLNLSGTDMQNNAQLHGERRMVVHSHEKAELGLLISPTDTLSDSGSVMHMPPTYSEANWR
ncbi:hypothetical protein PQX77_018004 [Marasmius sp. AFHP31]|nr:hypothetical protein PQX77_018004 [Marasmius sp. AFHP31]